MAWYNPEMDKNLFDRLELGQRLALESAPDKPAYGVIERTPTTVTIAQSSEGRGKKVLTREQFEATDLTLLQLQGFSGH
jgi:hypothetical protein